MGWEIEYYDEELEELVTLKGQIDRVYDELNGDSFGSFYLANTSENRALVASDKTAFIWFDDELQYAGVLSGVEYSRTRIKCTLYDEVLHLLNVAPPLGSVFPVFYDQKPASDILADVCNGTGITISECPSTPISVVLDLANRLDVARFIADTLGKDLWTGTLTISIGTKGTSKSLTVFTVSRRGIDRSKRRDKVIVKGVDKDGLSIQGEAGSGSNVKVYREKTPSDVATLDALAAKYLAELNTDSSGAPLQTDIGHGSALFAGDTVSIDKPLFALDGAYRIVQVTKNRAKVNFQIDRLRTPLDKAVADLSKYEELGIYQPGSQSPWTLNLQSLIGHYHLNEGDGSTAKDSAPIDEAHNGTITNGHWEQGPVTKVLTLQGDGYVNIGNSITFHAGSGVGKFSVGVWFSPSSLNSTPRYLASKSGQFSLSHVGADGKLRFMFVDAAETAQNYDSNAGIVTVGGRHFVMVTYDGAFVRMYVNGRLHKSFLQDDNICASTTDVLLGLDLEGVLAEGMFWQRCLSGQEVLELYFFPLNRLIASRLSSGAQPVIPFAALHQISTDAIAKTCNLGDLFAVVIAYPPFFRFVSLSTVKAILSPASSRVSSVSTVLAVVIS